MVFYCGQWRSPEAMERHKAKRYPSNDPSIPRPGMVFWNGGWRNPETVERAKRRQALQKRNGAHRRHLRDGDVCGRCGFVPVVLAQLDVHHRDGDHSNNAPENLETICANCHRLEHARLQIAAVEAA
jgi:5-methylcytosine-specific restriction endonuclease McrA